MTERELEAQLRVLAPDEWLDVANDVLAQLLPGLSDQRAKTFGAKLECETTSASDQSTRFIKIARELISEQDRDAIDRHYGYGGSSGWLGVGGLGWESDVDRRMWMDFKDRVERQANDEGVSMRAGLIGFGAASVLLTPFGWLGASGVAAVIGLIKLRTELRKERTLAAYGRLFALDKKGAVVTVTKPGDWADRRTESTRAHSLAVAPPDPRTAAAQSPS